MKEYKRENPLFSLCGLNCSLCPRYQSEGASKCPGCGGSDFHLKHPSCAVITCSKKHNGIEYCFRCEAYPCERYACASEKDSFITYRNVADDMRKAAAEGIESYQALLDKKILFLEYLLANYNDGRMKNFYCIAVNLLDIADLNDIKENIRKNISPEGIPLKDQIGKIVLLFQEAAKSKNISLKLRNSKKP